MRYYIELILLPDLGIPLHSILEKLFQQIHIALVENKTDDDTSHIGISFPEYNPEAHSLGIKLRLFSLDSEALSQLEIEKWLSRLRDYISINEIEKVPVEIKGYACFSQQKTKGNREKLARRRAKRKAETLEDAMVNFSNYKPEMFNTPYVNMVSQTNGQHFRLYIQRTFVENEQNGLFNCYGLSRTTTVPIF